MRGIIAAAAILAAVPATAGEVDVVDVRAQQSSAGIYSFAVALRHADAGWKHYANSWQVLSPDGKVLGVRKLLHPHDNEQPFTRSLNGVRIPPEITRVRVRGHDLVHGFGGKEMTIPLPGRAPKS